MANGRVRRGRATEELVAAYLRAHGWPLASRRPAALPGADIENTPGISFEVKARRELDLTGWLKQACTRDGIPAVVERPDGYGPETVEKWPAVLPFAVLVQLLREAGYGEPLDSEGT